MSSEREWTELSLSELKKLFIDLHKHAAKVTLPGEGWMHAVYIGKCPDCSEVHIQIVEMEPGEEPGRQSPRLLNS